MKTKRAPQGDEAGFTTCLFCRSRPANSKEHVVLNCLGGRKVVHQFLCVRCNNRLGKEIDSDLEAALRAPSVLIGCKRGDRASVAPLRGLKDGAGKGFTLFATGGAEQTGVQPFSELPASGAKKRTIAVTATNSASASMLLAHAMRKSGIKPEDANWTASQSIVPLQTTNMGMSVNSTAQQRAVAKMGLASITREFGRGGYDDDAFQSAFEFVAQGAEDGSVPFGMFFRLAQIRQMAGSLLGQHILWVCHEPQRSTVEVLFAAFGVLGFRVQLAGGDLPVRAAKINILHVVDPVTGDHTVRAMEQKPPLPRIESMGSDAGELKQAIAELYGIALRRRRTMWQESAVEDSTKPLDQVPNGAPIPPAVLVDIEARALAHGAAIESGQPVAIKMIPSDAERIWKEAVAIYRSLERSES